MTTQEKQNHIAKQLEKIVKKLESKYHTTGCWNHEYCCTFKMLGLET